MKVREIIRLDIPSSSEYVGVVRQTVEGIARRLSFSPDEIEDVKLAVGEACTNAIKHGVRHDARITIRYTICPDGLEIEVRNGVTTCKAPEVASCPPDPSAMNEGGLGLYLMQTLMDEVELSWEPGLVIVRMLKRTPQSRVPLGS